jgi:hypothetical protein
MKRRFCLHTAGLLAGILGTSPLVAASPSPTPFASQEKIAPRVATAQASDKAVAPADQEEVHSNLPKRSFLAPIGDFARDSILRPKTPFELVPGKDPHGWSFVLEPYAWAMGLDGKVGVKGLPALNVDVSAITLLQHLDWAIFARGEIRRGRWGLLGDGFYAELSASGDLGGVLYRSGSLTLQQGLASLALAYRIIDDRRGFLDFYAGARYNYLGVRIDASVDKDGVSGLTDQMTNRLAAGIDATVSQTLASNASLLEADIATLTQAALTARALEGFADTPKDIRDLVQADRLRRVFNSKNRAFANYIAAEAAVQLAAAKGQPTATLQSQADAARQKLARQLAKDIEDALPTSGSGDVWWFDPIIGLRGQINFTRWLFLAAQGDVGGFGAGSQIVWNVQATLGVNFTRNIFAELGYRYMYVDYENNGLLYQMNSFGLFSGIGVKF